MPPNWNDGISDEVELAERIRDRGVVFEPGERRGVQVEDGVAVARDLGRVGLAVEHPELAAVPRARSRLRTCRPRTRRDRSEAAASRRTARASAAHRDSVAVTGPLATASHPAGTSSDSVYRAFRSGWSKQGNARWARAGTNSVYRNSRSRLSGSLPATNSMTISFSPAFVASAGMTRWPSWNCGLDSGAAGLSRSGSGRAAGRSRRRCGGARRG